jgi:hypothetical protein
MSGLENAREGQVAVLAYKSTHVLLVCFNVGVACVPELGREFGLDRFANGFAPKPIALEVSVAICHGDFDASIEKSTEFLETTTKDKVTRLLETYHMISSCADVQILVCYSPPAMLAAVPVQFSASFK